MAIIVLIKLPKGGGKINTQNANDKISTELWMQHFANALVNQNAIDEKTYKKLMAKSTPKLIDGTHTLKMVTVP